MVAWIRNFINKLKRFGVERIVCSIFLFVFPIVLVLVYVFLGLPPGNSSEGAITVVDALEKLPTQWTFYAIIAALVVEYLVWRWRMFASLRKELQTKAKETKNKDGPTDRDWWVVQGLRKRGLALRTRADLILGSAFALLLAGIYLVIFVLPQISEIDRLLREQRQKAVFIDRFGNELECIVEGRCWVKMLEKFGEDVGQLLYRQYNIKASANDNIDARAFDKVSVSMTTDGGKIWSTSSPTLEYAGQVIAAAFSADGTTGLIASDEGSVFITTDGGKIWRWSTLNLGLARSEWVTEAFSADGTTGLIAGIRGSVSMTADRGKNWSTPNLGLARSERVTAAAFSANGTTGLIASDEAQYSITTDGGKNWSTPKLARGERVIAVALSANGTTSLERLITLVSMTTDGGKNWNTLRTLEDAAITETAFSADGRPA